MANSFVHIELNTDNVKAAKDFYKKIFKWNLSDMPMGPGMTYTMVKPEDGVGGGMQDKNSVGMDKAPTMWLPYVAVDSVKSTMGKVKKLGAQILVENQEVPGMGWLGIFLDPTGAPLGVWEAAKMAAAPKAKKPAAPKKAAKAKKAVKKPAKKASKKAGN